MNASANSKLIENLEAQLNRLVSQLKDLDECRDELSQTEYDCMKDETLEQIKEFTDILDQLNKGDVSLSNKFSTMRAAIRNAISSSFNTVEMIKMFGNQNITDLEKQLLQLEQDYKLKKLPMEEMEARKTEILLKLRQHGHSLSTKDNEFLESRGNNLYQQMEQIYDDQY